MEIVYRLSPGSNSKRRPEFFTKGRALASMLSCIETVADARLTFLCDGELPSPIASVLNDHGRVEQFGGVGNAASYRASVRWVLKHLPSDATVYFCEDDYLHLPGSLEALRDVMSTLDSGCYVTLYDHPDRHRGRDRTLLAHPTDALVGPGWRRVESTTMTYATTVATLERDAYIHQTAAARHYPRDRLLWLTLQGFGPGGLIRRGRRRLLFGAQPSFATHVEDEQLAPGVDWCAVANGASAWAESFAPSLARQW